MVSCWVRWDFLWAFCRFCGFFCRFCGFVRLCGLFGFVVGFGGGFLGLPGGFFSISRRGLSSSTFFGPFEGVYILLYLLHFKSIYFYFRKNNICGALFPLKNVLDSNIVYFVSVCVIYEGDLNHSIKYNGRNEGPLLTILHDNKPNLPT